MKVRSLTGFFAVIIMLFAVDPVWANQHLKMQKDIKPVMPGGMQAAPTLTRVERTGDGYALIGSGFGTDRTQVQAFEGSTQVPAPSVVSVTNDRITVKSPASGTVQHKVVVAGRSSSVVSFTHPTAQAAGTGLGVAKSPGLQEQLKAGTLVGKPGVVEGVKPLKEIVKGRDIAGIGTKAVGPGKKTGEDIIGSIRGRSGQSDDPCAPKQDPAQAAMDRFMAGTKSEEKTDPVSGLTGKRKVTGGGAVGSVEAGAQSGQSFGMRDSPSRPAKEGGEKGGGGGTTQGGGTWSGQETMVDRPDPGGGQTIRSHEEYKDSEGRMTIDSRANPDGSGEQTIRAENRDGTVTTATSTWNKDGKTTYSEGTRTKAEQDKADKEKADKEKAAKEKEQKEKTEKTEKTDAGAQTAKTSCRADDDRCINQMFPEPERKGVIGREHNKFRERMRKEIAEKMERQKQRAVRPADEQATGPRRTEADLRRAAADKKRGLTQPADPDRQTAQADPCGPQQQIKDREKMVPGRKGIDPTPGEGYRKGTR